LAFYSLEENLFKAKHTKSVLDKEKDKLSKILVAVKQQNGQLNREITRSKTYNNKADVVKKRNDSMKRLKEDLTILNTEIEDNDRELDREDRNLKDRNLLKRQNDQTFELKRRHGKVEIDINIAKSKLQELQGLREMALRAI
jgi:hypothetical protein